MLNGTLWWDQELDDRGRPIRGDVRAAAHETWTVACGRTRAALGDMCDAAALMEKSVVQVSRYLDARHAVPFAQNVKALLMCAFCRTLRRYFVKLDRIQPAGGVRDFSDRPRVPSWAALIDLRLDAVKISRRLSHRSCTMLGLRSAGFEWKEIAQVLNMTDAAARASFWREVRRLNLRSPLSASSGKGCGAKPRQLSKDSAKPNEKCRPRSGHD